jgi:adenylosuccinate lyase
VLLALVEKGMSREEAYATVQSCAHTAWNQPDGDFHALVAKDPKVTALLSPEEIEDCFNPQNHLKYLDTIYQRLNI